MVYPPQIDAQARVHFQPVSEVPRTGRILFSVRLGWDRPPKQGDKQDVNMVL